MFDAGGEASRWRTPASTTEVMSLRSRRLTAAPDEDEQDAERRRLGQRVQAGEDVARADDADRPRAGRGRRRRGRGARRSRRPSFDEPGDHPVADRADQRDGDERRAGRRRPPVWAAWVAMPPMPDEHEAVEGDDPVGERRAGAEAVARTAPRRSARITKVAWVMATPSAGRTCVRVRVDRARTTSRSSRSSDGAGCVDVVEEEEVDVDRASSRGRRRRSSSPG